MMLGSITRAHLASRSQQLETMRTPRNRRAVWRHARFRFIQVPSTATTSSQSLKSVLLWEDEAHLLAGVRASQRLE